MIKSLIAFCLLLICFSCKTPEARKPISVKTGSFIDASVERNKKLFTEQQSIIEGIIAKDDTKNYITSPNGFWYYYNTKSTNDSLFTAEFGDIINYSYNIKDLSGNLIYSKNHFKNLNYTMDKEELFSGLREGLKLMKAGETVTFLFPSQKAYGYYGDENKIGINIPLICEVTVNNVTKSQLN